jgi:hypothetical protein
MHQPFRSIAVAVFDTAADAERSVQGLRRAGFGADEIGILEPDADVEHARVTDAAPDGQDIPSGVRGFSAAGAVIGGLLGAVTALVIPGIGAVVAGGILATSLGAALGVAAVLAAFGLSDRQASFYERQLGAGRTIVTVEVAGRYEKATQIFRAHGARWIDATGNGSTQSVGAESSTRTR